MRHCWRDVVGSVQAKNQRRPKGASSANTTGWTSLSSPSLSSSSPSLSLSLKRERSSLWPSFSSYSYGKNQTQWKGIKEKVWEMHNCKQCWMRFCQLYFSDSACRLQHQCKETNPLRLNANSCVAAVSGAGHFKFIKCTSTNRSRSPLPPSLFSQRCRRQKAGLKPSGVTLTWRKSKWLDTTQASPPTPTSTSPITLQETSSPRSLPKMASRGWWYATSNCPEFGDQWMTS